MVDVFMSSKAFSVKECTTARNACVVEDSLKVHKFMDWVVLLVCTDFR